MDTLLTWSGEASHEVASFFRRWLSDVLPGIQPWISDEDIAKGKKWFPELTAQLGKSHVSITFITPEKVRSPWIYYEVGVIAAKLDQSLICPNLIGFDSKYVKDTPLGQYQCTLAEKHDTWKLIKSINGHLDDRKHEEKTLEGDFNSHWPQLEGQLDKLVKAVGEARENVTETEPSIEEQLSDEARMLIVEALQDRNGRIIYHKSMDSTDLGTNETNFTEDNSPRTEAIWKSALEELRDFGLIFDIGYKGEIFRISKTGYEVGERIRSRASRDNSDDAVFADIEGLMPDLMTELRRNLSEHPLLRDLIVMKSSTYAYNFDGQHLKFGEDTIPELRSGFRTLSDRSS